MSNDIKTELDRVSAIRLQMLELHPFWGHLLIQMKIVPSTQLNAFAATDCVQTIWFNPSRTRHLSLSQLGFVMAHELGHVFLVSHERRRGRNHHLWNCATDYAINRIVAEIEHPARPGMPLYERPDGVYPELGKIRILLDRRFENRIAEAIYERLAAETMNEAKSVVVTLAVPGTGGRGQLRIPDVSDHDGGIDVHLPMPAGHSESEAVRDALEGAVRAWAQSGQRGHMPGSVQRQFASNVRPTIPWNHVLKRYLGEAVSRSELSYHRPNLRYLTPAPDSTGQLSSKHGFILPGQSPGALAWVVIALDTSASMDRANLDLVAAELRSIATQVDDITLIVADAKVHQVESGSAVDTLLTSGRVRGGGGTNHRPVFEWIAAQGRVPDLFIGLTDLFTVFPTTRPRYPVLWVTPQIHGEAPWGPIIQCGT
ncbi:MAG: VWA-like domain-containing protein [Myxococcota bacterium]|nr:VWA-like domain-containing protein [Myxococcota bacterium]